MNYKAMVKAVLCLSCIFLLFGCEQENSETISEDTIDSERSVIYDQDDAYQDYLNQEYESINLSSLKEDLQIKEAGTYVLSGTLQGSVKIAVGKEETVRLVLDNASILASDYAAIYCSQAKKLILSLKEGTTNVVSDEIAYTNVVDDEPTATIFAKDDLSINGTGSLQINALVNDAITSKDTLKLMEGSYQITAFDDGIVGRDFVYIHDGTYTIEAQGDAIKTTYDTDEEKGDIAIENGEFHLQAGGDGMQATQNLTIYDGDYGIVSGGGSVNASTSTNAFQPGGFGQWKEETSQTSEDTPSAKGIKAESAVSIHAGIFNFDTSDDAIHSNSTVDILGGNFTIQSGDDGIHADRILNIKEGSIHITKSYEGLEGATVNIDGGDIRVVASDDGINAAGGSDEESSNPSADKFSSSGDYAIHINGGTTQVDASGDGLDSNRTITMNGGVMVVSGPVDNGNSALDFDGECTINGGILITSGSSGMASSPSTASEQNVVIINTSTSQAANSILYLSDAEGTILLGIKPAKAYSNVIISSPDLLSDTTYQIYSNASGGSVNDAGYIESEVEGGTLVESITIQNRITSVGTASGSMGPGGMGQGGQGGMEQGGMEDRGQPR